LAAVRHASRGDAVLTLWGVPALDEYPHRVPARVYNLWRRWWMRRHATLRFDLEGLPPMALDLEERQWVVVDGSLADMPILAWSDFRDADRALHEAVNCTVTHFHFGASKLRDPAIERLAQRLGRELGSGMG
jgi:hypothetical protein